MLSRAFLCLSSHTRLPTYHIRAIGQPEYRYKTLLPHLSSDPFPQGQFHQILAFHPPF